MSDLAPRVAADTIKAFRASVGLSQVAFAAELGVSRRTVEEWEKPGAALAPGYVLLALAALNAGLKPWGSEAKS